MLAKVPVKRLDGKSSFVALTDYIVKEASAVRHSDEIFSAESAGTDMALVASMNERVKDAVYHYVLSWRAGENPTDAQAFDSVTATLSALDLREHQWICAVHRNTDHVHTHVAVNRISPLTYKSVYPKGDWIALDRVCRQLEIKHQWSHSQGPHVAELGRDNTMHVVRTQRDNSDTSKLSPSTRARNFAAWNGVESFQEWVGKAPVDALRRALDRSNASWIDVHQTLIKYNLEYRTKGSGAVVVDRNEPDTLHAKASHLGRFASLAQLSSRLGPFMPSIESETRQQSPEQGKAFDSLSSYGHNVPKEVLYQGRRGAEKVAIVGRPSNAKSEREASEGQRRQRAWSQQRASEQTRIGAFRDEIRAARQRIKSTRSRHTRRVMYSVQAFVAAGKRDTLQRLFRDERRQLRVHLKSIEIGTRHERISHQAAASDDAAVATLRNLHYRERAERRSRIPRIEIGTVSGAGEPRKPILEGINWVADARGVDYRARNRTLFRDEGRRVVFCIVDDDAVQAGLMLCREKWASGLCLSGTDEFNVKVRSMAAKMHIRIIEPAIEQLAPGSQPIIVQQSSEASENAADATGNDLERLYCSFGKPTYAAELRAGRQHTGKIIDAMSGAGDTGIVVMDVGRELAIIRTDFEAAGRMNAAIGQRMTARAASTGNDSKTIGWQFGVPQCVEPDLQHSR